jgi:hypothetical protein
MTKKNFKTNFDTLLGEDVKTKTKSQDAEIRATFLLKSSYAEKLKAISYWERKKIKEVLNEALTLFLEQYEKEKGPIQLPK